MTEQPRLYAPGERQARREAIAATVLAEWYLLRHRFPESDRGMDALARRAVMAADCLIAELDRPPDAS